MAEQLVIKLFENAGYTCTKAPKGTKQYDFTAVQDIYTILLEVKFDSMSDLTGNLAFEYWNPKKNEPSGLMISQADFWAYCFGNPLQAHIVELPILKEYIDTHKPKRIIDVGGDKNASLYLYERSQIISDIFWRVDEIDSHALNAGLQTSVNSRNNKFTKQDIENFIEENK